MTDIMSDRRKKIILSPVGGGRAFIWSLGSMGVCGIPSGDDVQCLQGGGVHKFIRHDLGAIKKGGI